MGETAAGRADAGTGPADAAPDTDPGPVVLADFAPGETERYTGSWRRIRRILLGMMLVGPLAGAFVLLNPGATLVFVVPVVALYELALWHLYRKQGDLLDRYAGWDLTERGIHCPLRRDRETKEVGRRFLPYDAVDAVYFRGTPRLVSLVWPEMPADVRARYADRAPRALDAYVVIVEADGGHTALKKEDVGEEDDVETLKAALADRVKVVG